MTEPRTHDHRRLLAAATIAVITLAGCARLDATSPRSEDVVFLRAGNSVSLVHTLAGGQAVRLPNSVPSTDWSAVVQAEHLSDATTRIQAIDSLSGDRLWEQDVPGRLEVKVAAASAHLVALGSPRGSTGYPVGRSSTTLAIVDEGSDPRMIELDGNFEPEAFSTDGQSLFVVQYLPAERPSRYQVRRLDLATERVVGVYTVDADLQEAMEGTARIQAASGDGTRLYTLYTTAGPDGTMRAFVHVLSLDELWAHCVDLPETFATARESAVALSVSPDGSRLYAADASTGTVAEIDTQTLAVARTTQMELARSGGPAHAAVGSDGTIYLGKGNRLVALEASTLAPGRSWDTRGRITGIQAAEDGRRLYVGLRDEIMVIDMATGEELEPLDPGAVGAIDQLGESTRLLDEERTLIECAC